MGCTLQYVPSGLSLCRRQGSLGSLVNLVNLVNLGRTILNFLNFLNLPNFLSLPNLLKFSSLIPAANIQLLNTLCQVFWQLFFQKLYRRGSVWWADGEVRGRVSLLSQCHGVTRGGGRVISVTGCDWVWLGVIRKLRRLRKLRKLRTVLPKFLKFPNFPKFSNRAFAQHDIDQLHDDTVCCHSERSEESRGLRGGGR